MAPPVFALLVAGSLQLAIEVPRPADVPRILAAAPRAIRAVRPGDGGAGAPTVRDIPYYYDRLEAETLPAVPPRVTYDWRSPVVFDRP